MQVYKREPGPHPVAEQTATWHDAQRERDVPVRVYMPEALGKPAPLVVFSHGLGSSRDGYTYLGRHWAGHGYVVLYLTHLGSDATAYCRPGGLPAPRLIGFLEDVEHRRDRPRDVAFVLDHVAEDTTLRKRVDFEHVAVAGHSYGAHTALALVGLQFDPQEQGQVGFADPRVRAAIAMSPASEGKLGLHADSWNRIDRPVMALSGTRDIEWGVGSAARRRMSFDRTHGRDQYLLMIRGATHATFDDQQDLRIPVKPRDPVQHDYIRMATTAFLDSYLKHDAAAQRWLLSGALVRLSRGACELESKQVTLHPGR